MAPKPKKAKDFAQSAGSIAEEIQEEADEQRRKPAHPPIVTRDASEVTQAIFTPKTDGLHVLNCSGNIDKRVHGAEEISQRIAKWNWEWIKKRTKGNKALAINYILLMGIQQLSKELKEKDIIVIAENIPLEDTPLDIFD